ncbi:hypothetical protein IB237_05865 [Agrobacterium sp. AGB01]|nr:hypothetical protein [Agrobacterium sp. AGB01]MBD9386694.1 hypothetical protein [Agrobacterium sp. AGB01]
MPGLVTKALLTAALFALSLQAVHAQTTPTSPIEDLPVAAIFVASSGLWEDEPAPAAATTTTATSEAPPPAAAPPRRGYYKVVAMRQNDGTARIFMQQIAYTPNGPDLIQTVELEEFSKFKAYVTDIRPESSSGNGNVPGLFVTVHLKTDPMSTETEAWTVLIDELGDMKIERASN